MSDITETKKCPYCAEIINADAIKCKHCGEILDPVLRETRQLQASSTADDAIKKKSDTEEMRFLYDKLRAEILQNDLGGTQLLSYTLLLVAAAMGFALQPTTHVILRISVLLAVIFLLFISMVQTSSRMRGTFLIATYLREFIEPNTKDIKWEIRLQSLRNESPKKGHNLFSTLIFTYIAIAMANLLLIIYYTIRQGTYFEKPPMRFILHGHMVDISGQYFAEVLASVGILTIFGMVSYAEVKFNRIIRHNQKYLSDGWASVRNKESR